MCSPLALSDIDDEIWPRYAEAYAAIPEISKGYPNQTTLMSVNPDFIMGSYKSAFRERSCTVNDEGVEKCRGIFTDATGVGPCDGENSDFFPSGSNKNSSYSTCRPQLHAQGIGTWLEPASCKSMVKIALLGSASCLSGRARPRRQNSTAF